MEAREWTFTDKTEWGEGAWQSEPDKKQWLTKSGLPGLIVRGPSGGLCGYVGVTSAHPWFEKGYDDCRVSAPDEDGDDWLEVHGGLTFAARCQPEREHGICHIVEDGEDDNVWWLGFDTAHCDDLSPAHSRWRSRSENETYKDLAYVEHEVERLAKQAAAESSDEGGGERMGR